MIIRLNGENIEIAANTNLLALLVAQNLKPEAVVIELNAKVIDANNFAQIVLNNNDTVEILHFVGGG